MGGQHGSSQSQVPYLANTVLFTFPPIGGLFIWKAGERSPAPPLKGCPYTIIYELRAETNHVSKVYPAVIKFYNVAPQKDCLDVLLKEIHFVFKNDPVLERK